MCLFVCIALVDAQVPAPLYDLLITNARIIFDAVESFVLYVLFCGLNLLRMYELVCKNKRTRFTSKASSFQQQLHYPICENTGVLWFSQSRRRLGVANLPLNH